MKAFLVVLFALLLCACTNEESAMRALNGAGYKDIQMTGYSFFQCSEDDFYSTGFEAIGPTGNKVSGAVCAGFWLKGSPIRTD